MAAQPEHAHGMVVRLTNLPIDVSIRALKAALADRYFPRACYNFLVVPEISSEDIFWQFFERPDRRITASMVIPTDRLGNNEGNRILHDGGNVVLHREGLSQMYGDRLDLQAELVHNPATTAEKYAQLHEQGRVLNTREGLDDGLIGYVRSVSCGTINENNVFQTTFKWNLLPDPQRQYREFAYFGDVRPQKFHVPLSTSPDPAAFKLEWMDIHDPNILGLIFDDGQDDDDDLDKVYFVLGKPPQFYERIFDMQNNKFVNSRVCRPSSGPQFESLELDASDVPWIIQHSRVFRVEYERAVDFSLQTYEPRLSDTRQRHLISFHHPGIPVVEGTLGQMRDLLRANLDDIKSQDKHGSGQYLQALFRLIYNGNVCAMLGESREAIEWLVRNDYYVNSSVWIACEVLTKAGQDMKLSQFRALHRLYEKVLPNEEKGEFKLPERLMDTGTEPELTLEMHFDLSSWRQKNLRFTKPPIQVYELLVYPSHLELEGPIDPNSNSIIERYRSENFLRVRFVDNDQKSLKAEAGINLGKIANNRVFSILSNQNQLLTPICQSYDFLGYSVSSLKKRKAAWFFRSDSTSALPSIHTIIHNIGKWDRDDPINGELALRPSKWGARLALVFTESIPIGEVADADWTLRKDIGAHTDGCGIISNQLCNTINRTLAPFGFKKSRAFQIRFGGVKGVVYAGADSLLQDEKGRQYQMRLRISQRKFQVSPTQLHQYPVTDRKAPSLRIVSTAGDNYTSLFFPAALKAFEDSRVRKQNRPHNQPELDIARIEAIYEDTYHELTQGTTETLLILQQIFRIPEDDRTSGVKTRYSLLKLMIKLYAKGIFCEDYENSFLSLYLAKLAMRAREKDPFKIPIPGSYQVLGLTDDYQILGQDEVFIRVHVNGEDITVEGPIVIYRDPIIHIGDIQRATAISQETMQARMKRYPADFVDRINNMKAMRNVIFFSQDENENPPLPSKLSGGDLDGDRFEILTEHCGFLASFEPSDPAEYADNGHHAQRDPNMRPFDITEVARFIGQYVENDCFAELQERLMCLADGKPQGLQDKGVKKLGPWLSKAVDYAKNGEAVQLAQDVLGDPDFQVRAKPDFVRALNHKVGYDLNGEYYASDRLLGRLYRSIQQKQYVIPENVDRSGLGGLLRKVRDDLAPVLQRIAAFDSGSIEENHRFGELLQGLNGAMNQIVRSNMQQYEGHVAWQYQWQGAASAPQFVSASVEVTLFLRKKQDDFFDNFIGNLIVKISEHLCRYGVITLSDHYPNNRRIGIGKTYDLKIVIDLYRQCFFYAW